MSPRSRVPETKGREPGGRRAAPGRGSGPLRQRRRGRQRRPSAGPREARPDCRGAEDAAGVTAVGAIWSAPSRLPPPRLSPCIIDDSAPAARRRAPPPPGPAHPRPADPRPRAPRPACPRPRAAAPCPPSSCLRPEAHLPPAGRACLPARRPRRSPVRSGWLSGRRVLRAARTGSGRGSRAGRGAAPSASQRPWPASPTPPPSRAGGAAGQSAGTRPRNTLAGCQPARGR